MAKGIRRQLKKARENVKTEIRLQAKGTGRYAGPVSSEGYAGGYRDALEDVQQALNGVTPNNSRFWPNA